MEQMEPNQTTIPFLCRWGLHAYGVVKILWANQAHTMCLERCRKCGAEREFDQQDYH
jgi:hypothetical protein